MALPMIRKLLGTFKLVGTLMGAVVPLVMCAPAHALSINKTALEIDLASAIKKGVTFITVSNEKDIPVFISSQIQGWKIKPNGTFELSDTTEVKVTPSVANLAPNASATFQVRYVGDAERIKQGAYRLTLKESPRLNMEDLKEGLGARLMLTANMSLPVFVTPKGALSDAFDKVSVKWGKGTPTEEGKPRIKLEIANTGERYVMAQELKMGGASVKALAQYLLPGDAVTLEVEPQGSVPDTARLEMMLRYLSETKTIEIAHE